MREHRIKKREEAEERNEHTLPENRRAVREPLSERPKRK
jgi:hypothetical protein